MTGSGARTSGSSRTLPGPMLQCKRLLHIVHLDSRFAPGGAVSEVSRVIALTNRSKGSRAARQQALLNKVLTIAALGCHTTTENVHCGGKFHVQHESALPDQLLSYLTILIIKPALMGFCTSLYLA